jgi:hypothetical protein
LSSFCTLPSIGAIEAAAGSAFAVVGSVIRHL